MSLQSFSATLDYRPGSLRPALIYICLHTNLFIKAITRTKLELLTLLCERESSLWQTSTVTRQLVLSIIAKEFQRTMRGKDTCMSCCCCCCCCPSRLGEMAARERVFNYQPTAISYQPSAISIQIYDYALKRRIKNIHKLLLFYRSIHICKYIYRYMYI